MTTTIKNNNSYFTYSSSANSSHSLPPIHGDDPPRKLRYYHDSSAPMPNKYQHSISLVKANKRKRGRPPSSYYYSMDSKQQEDDQLTFLAPTVLNIPTSKDQKERELKANKQQPQVVVIEEDTMTAFTSSNMDTVLYMPRMKRGRKPKTSLHGNSCFIWKDLTSTRSSSK